MLFVERQILRKYVSTTKTDTIFSNFIQYWIYQVSSYYEKVIVTLSSLPQRQNIANALGWGISSSSTEIPRPQHCRFFRILAIIRFNSFFFRRHILAIIGLHRITVIGSFQIRGLHTVIFVHGISFTR